MKNLILYIFTSLITYSPILSQDKNVSDLSTYCHKFEVTINVTDGINTQPLTIGIHPEGTDGFDIGLDSLAPPLPPSGAFGALLEWLDQQYFKDIRDSSIETKEFLMKYQPQTGGSIVLYWNSNALDTLGKFIIVDDITGNLFSLDMSTIDSLDVSVSPFISNKLKILVTPICAIENHNPTANPDSAMTNEDVSFDINVLENDFDPDGDSLIVENVNNGSHGTVTNNNDGSVTYTPDPNFFGTDSFHYVITDGLGGYDTSFVNIEVLPVNDAPVVSGLPDISFAEDDSARLDLDGYVEDVDDDSSSLSWVAQVLTASTEVDLGDLQVTIDEVSHEAVFRCTADTSGVFTVAFTATDTSDASDSDTLQVTVTSVNDAPVVTNAISDVSYAEDSGVHTVVPDLNMVFTDPDPGDVLSFAASSDNSDIQLIVEGSSLKLNTTLNYFGTGNVVVTATDDGGLSAQDTFMVTITPVNDAPVISGLPEQLEFDANSSDTLKIWDYVEDVETEDSLLTYVFSSQPDSLVFSYDPKIGEVIISARESTYHGYVMMFILVQDTEGASTEDTIAVLVKSPTGIQDHFIDQVPQKFVLMQNYPNPFNPVTRIWFGLPGAANVKLEVYNLLGQRVAILVDRRYPAGYHVVEFDASNLSSGLYLYRLQADGFVRVRKMLLMK